MKNLKRYLRNCFPQMHGEMRHVKCLMLVSVLCFNIPYIIATEVVELLMTETTGLSVD